MPTQLKIANQLEPSSSARSIIITDASSKPSYFAPTTGADRLLMWDDSATAWASATLGTNLSFSGTTLNAATGNNIYTANGSIPAATSRVVTLADTDSALSFVDSSTISLLEMGEGQITFMNGDIQWTDSTELQINPAFGGTTITWTADLDITVNSGLFTITDSRVGAAQTGIVYAADYSANYTDRSLVDREFVDNAIAAAAVSLNTTIAYIEGSTATTIDLDANVGNVKDRNGNNIAFTIPTNPDDMEVYRNGQQIYRTGTLTTRDYSINTGTNEITFVTALTATEIVVIIKREIA